MERALAMPGYSRFTMQPCPCQPIWITLSPSTRTGTVRWPFARARILSRAAGSASTSYSTKSVPFHSSHSRISCVYWHVLVPKSSSIAGKRLQRFTNHVIHRGLNFLNPGNVIGMHDERKIRQPSPLDFAAIVAEQSHRQQVAFAGLFKRHQYISRAPARGNCDGHIVGLIVRMHRPLKNHVRP